jgi:hypothetical protein
MIGIKLAGGLGNQMFQYALGRALSEKTGLPLYLDIAWYYHIPSTDTQRTFDLNCFDIKGNIFRSDDVSPFSFHRIKFLEKVMRKLSQKKLLPLKELFVEEKPGFDERVLAFNQKKYLDGYWQSPKYFQEIREILLKEFSLTDLNEFDHKMISKMNDSQSVSIHIRRGDYVSNEYAKSVHLVCDRNYYDLALEKIKSIDRDVKLFFFSDDPAWVKEEFGNLDIEVIEGNDDRPWVDMHLMSQCKHHIIANSSFSWWGAWLSEREGQTIAPKIWFTNGDEMNDLIPNYWIRL